MRATVTTLPPGRAADPGCACPDGLGRRAFLGAAAGAAALTYVSTSATGFLFGEGAAGAATPSAAPAGGRLVVVFLRGGMDGLSAVIPADDGTYHQGRPGIGVGPDEVLDLASDTFGLHPAMAPLLPLYSSGRVGFVHAVGNPGGKRSHFDDQAFMEAGDDGPSTDGKGWLGRYLAATSGAGSAVARGAALSVNLTPSLRGSASLAVPAVAGYGLRMFADRMEPALAAFHAGTGDVARTGAAALASIDAVSALEAAPVPGGGPSAAAFGDVVALLGGGLGLEVVTLDVGGWDTHTAMGDASAGEMRDLLGGLAADLAGFQSELDSKGMGDVTTVVLSEFGRRVAQNGSGGLDHGRGGLMTVLGAGIAGGQVLGDWPGLVDLDSGDLRVTTDFRSVLWELVRDRLGVVDPASVFPGFSPDPVGVTD